MAQIALDGSKIAPSVASNHIRYRKWEITGYGSAPCTGRDEDGVCVSWGTRPAIRDWVYYNNASATIEGTATASVKNVTIQGKAPVVQGDNTKENDKYSLPSGGSYVSGQHTNASGRVTVGNSRNVYANGKLIAVGGSSVQTHAGTSTTINGGLSTTVSIG